MIQQQHKKVKRKLLVIEGIDGSGKTTQIKLLSQELKVKKIPFEVISFPQYGKNEYADKIESYLKGEQSFDSYSIAKAYASDRKTASNKIKNWLQEGKLVIANRYVSSSKAHLGANMPDDQREKFIQWLDELEYQENGMPKEDLTILLSIDPAVGQKNVVHAGPACPQRQQAGLRGGRDIHEESLRHLEKASQIYLDLAKTEKNWVVINCMDDEQMKSPKEIQSEIIRIVSVKFPN